MPSYLTCSIRSCTRRRRARGWCALHYKRWLKNGTTDRLYPTLSDRFWAKVRKSDGCWPWIKSRQPYGYGRFNYQGKQVQAHRVAWILTNGPIPDDLCVLHSCDNPPCCNPDHLFLGTKGDNNRDCIRKGRGRWKVAA